MKKFNPFFEIKTQPMILATASSGLPEAYAGGGFFHSDVEKMLWDFHSAGLWIGPRVALERMPEFRQIIPYVVLRVGDRVVRYTRAPAGGENRLHGRQSIGLGGHIDLADVAIKNNSIDLSKTLLAAAEREVAEELGEIKCTSREWLGILVDNSNDVGRVHIGVVEVWNLEAAPTKSTEDAIGDVGLYSINELRHNTDRLETWSTLLLSAIEVLA
jgi:predicted NUDIX family phosphoesterase